jgi:hypothetical protein
MYRLVAGNRAPGGPKRSEVLTRVDPSLDRTLARAQPSVFGDEAAVIESGEVRPFVCSFFLVRPASGAVVCDRDAFVSAPFPEGCGQ